MEERHLKILTLKEVDELYGLPSFDELQREEYFYLNEPERLAMLSMRGLAAKVYFILQLGYFKAKQQFYIFTFAEVQTDIVTILRTHFAADYSPNLIKDLLDGPATVSKPTRLTQQKIILELTGYQSATTAIRKLLLRKAQYLARIHSKPIYIFRELVHFLQHRCIVLPGYTVLQQHIVSRALVLDRGRLEQLLSKHLSPEEVSLLNALLEKEEESPMTDQPYYPLTYLQQEPANFNYQTMRQQLERKALLEPIYNIAVRVLPALDLSNENIHYYASLAHYYTIYKLKRFQSNIVHLYLLCFAFSWWQQINDILIEAFRYHVRDFTDRAKAYAKDQVIRYHLAANEQLNKVPQLLGMFTDPNITDDTSFGEIRRQVFTIIERDDIDLVSQYIERYKLDDKALEWSYYDLNKRKLSYTMRYLFAHLHFKSNTQSTIICKLGSYSRTNRTKQPLWEYDNIVRTEYILRYLNSKQLRRNVQKSLNRGESYHNLRKHIAYVNQGKFRVHSVQEQQVWSECTRLVANCMVYYNTYLLTELLHQKHSQLKELSSTGENNTLHLQEAIATIKQVSPIAWRHIHIYGMYQFLRQDELINWEDVIKDVNL